MTKIFSLPKLTTLCVLSILLPLSGCERENRPTSVAQQEASAAKNAEPSSDESHGSEHKNILLIVADDMGYSDWGLWGEIKTPYLDYLAQQGVTFSHFYAAPTCSLARSMLLTGADSHQVGLGTMAELIPPDITPPPGYEGHLNDARPTIAELLQAENYLTVMAGKWHLGKAPEQNPSQRGFEHSFALLEGGASHFADKEVLYQNYTATYTEDGMETALPADYYSSDHFTDKIIGWLQENNSQRPFFAYLAFQAPHNPLHVTERWIDQYAGQYDGGYESLRQQRLAKLERLGVIPTDIETDANPADTTPWENLSSEQQRDFARRMEVYAAMMSNMDDNIGRLLTYLQNTTQYENTLIIYLSDNGANGNLITDDLHTTAAWVEANSDNRLENIGRPHSRTLVGPGWSHASMAPFRMHKSYLHEGGIRSPLIVSSGGIINKGPTPTVKPLSQQQVHITDIAPTLLDYAAITLTAKKVNKPVPMIGSSLMAFLRGESATIHEPDWSMGFEFLGDKAIIHQDWKALFTGPIHQGDSAWHLYNIAQDPAELHDLAETETETLAALQQRWQAYAKRHKLKQLDWMPGPKSAGTADKP